MNETNDKLILRIGFDNVSNKYSAQIPEGMSLNEVVFGFAALVRCLVRDGIIDDHKVIYDLLTKYLTESQYEEVKENGDV